VTDLAQRYGTRRGPARFAVLAVVALVAAAGVAWLAWAIVAQSLTTVQGQLVSFRPPSAHAVVAKVMVTRPRSEMAASCVLQAVASDNAVVGELGFRVGPPQPATVTVTRTIRTERQAFNVQLVRCVAAH
jgi:hypothetical protein